MNAYEEMGIMVVVCLGWATFGCLLTGCCLLWHKLTGREQKPDSRIYFM